MSMMLRWLISDVLLTSAVLWQVVSSYPTYQQQIPNGDSVPHPCKPNTFWAGVGHQNDQGSGERNAFGRDFEREGKIWTQSLCHLDSDGDGLTNGQELGDPECVWTPNTLPSRQVGLSNPGICDPWDSPVCFSNNITSVKYQTQEEWMRDMCRAGPLLCPGLNESVVHQVALTIDNGTQVPFMDKTYYCQIFDLESHMTIPGNYQIIAVEPVIDNAQVLHHIALFGCDDVQPASPAPFDCGVFPSISCHTFITIWTIGSPGDCFHPDTGISVGSGGFTKFAVQLFWNNPSGRDDLLDSSGVKIYYTEKRRPYELGLLKIGHESFLVPPNHPAVSFKSTCTSVCTKSLFNGTVYVTMAWNHMHYIGKQMQVQVLRNKTDIQYLTFDPIYNFDSPQIHVFQEKPFQLYPGDEIITTCIYNSQDLSWTTPWGEATTEEMCYGFLVYYPKENALKTSCVTLGPDVNYCDNSTFHGCSDLQRFSSPFFLSDADFYQDILHNCRTFSPCVEECTNTIVQLKKNDPCFQDELFDFIKDQMLNTNPIGQDMMARIASCQRQVDSVFNISRNTRT
ncbi:DBH monooxygenase protein 1 [Biomphalaria glabrata]|nr:DBH monooxygenase protein 1 [Biomphalaria glabrata]